MLKSIANDFANLCGLKQLRSFIDPPRVGRAGLIATHTHVMKNT